MTAFDETDDNLIEGDGLKEYFYNKKIEKTDGSDNYFSNDCIWPDPGQESDVLHFFAYYPGLNSGASLVNASSVNGSDKTIGYKLNGFKVAQNIADQVDFVTAYSTGTMADNLFSGIQLNFEHRLSRIEVKAWGANKSCDIEIAGVRIGGVNTNGNFDFTTNAWSGQSKGTVEHISSLNEKLVILSKNNKSHATSDAAASIMGANLGDENNCAMLIPTVDKTGWKYGTDINNADQGMYISVLLRVLDKTPDGNDKQQYPYYDNSQGLNAMDIPRVLLAVDNEGKIKANFGKLYKGDDGKYYEDSAKTTEYKYTVPQGCTVKEFGWATLPVTANWEPGCTYSYTLDYSLGVGLHDPETPGSVSPKAGDPVISDRVGIKVEVNDWQGLNGTTTHTVEVPGS